MADQFFMGLKVIPHKNYWFDGEKLGRTGRTRPDRVILHPEGVREFLTRRSPGQQRKRQVNVEELWHAAERLPVEEFWLLPPREQPYGPDEDEEAA